MADLTFQLCNMGGELVSVEGFADNFGQAMNPSHLNDSGQYAAEAWITLQRLVAQGWLWFKPFMPWSTPVQAC